MSYLRVSGLNSNSYWFHGLLYLHGSKVSRQVNDYLEGSVVPAMSSPLATQLRIDRQLFVKQTAAKNPREYRRSLED